MANHLVATLLILGVFTWLAAPAVAHQPAISDGTAVDPEKAIEVTEVQISRVFYHTVTEATPRVWLTFEVESAQGLWVQLGLPVIDRLADYRPTIALLGPGLPPVDLPFAIPEGVGGWVLDSADVTEPRVFDEPFSGTSSWILLEVTVDLPAAGRYYVVAYDPSGTDGKLWVALGREEVFGLGDIAALGELLPQVQAFHETESGGGIPCFFFPLALIVLGLAAVRIGPAAARWRR